MRSCMLAAASVLVLAACQTARTEHVIIEHTGTNNPLAEGFDDILGYDNSFAAIEDGEPTRSMEDSRYRKDNTWAHRPYLRVGRWTVDIRAKLTDGYPSEEMQFTIRSDKKIWDFDLFANGDIKAYSSGWVVIGNHGFEFTDLRLVFDPDVNPGAGGTGTYYINGSPVMQVTYNDQGNNTDDLFGVHCWTTRDSYLSTLRLSVDEPHIIEHAGDRHPHDEGFDESPWIDSSYATVEDGEVTRGLNKCRYQNFGLFAANPALATEGFVVESRAKVKDVELNLFIRTDAKILDWDFRAGGNLYVYGTSGWTPVTTYDINAFEDLKLVFDPSVNPGQGGTYTYYFNGTQVYQMTHNDASASTDDMFGFYNFGGNASAFLSLHRLSPPPPPTGSVVIVR